MQARVPVCAPMCVRMCACRCVSARARVFVCVCARVRVCACACVCAWYSFICKLPYRYIQRYNDPPVVTWLSVHGTVSGVAGFPNCNPDGALHGPCAMNAWAVYVAWAVCSA